MLNFVSGDLEYMCYLETGMRLHLYKLPSIGLVCFSVLDIRFSLMHIPVSPGCQKPARLYRYLRFSWPSANIETNVLGEEWMDGCIYFSLVTV